MKYYDSIRLKSLARTRYWHLFHGEGLEEACVLSRKFSNSIDHHFEIFSTFWNGLNSSIIVSKLLVLFVQHLLELAQWFGLNTTSSREVATNSHCHHIQNILEEWRLPLRRWHEAIYPMIFLIFYFKYWHDLPSSAYFQRMSFRNTPWTFGWHRGSIRTYNFFNFLGTFLSI